MSTYDEKPCLIGTMPCGCITYARIINYEVEITEPSVAKEIRDEVRNGCVFERTTVGEARMRPYFLQHECPHRDGAA